MKLGVPWSVKGIRPEARETAKEAARRAGMPLSEWLNSVILDSAAEQGIDADEEIFGESGGAELGAVNAKLDALSQRLERLTRGPEAYAPPHLRAQVHAPPSGYAPVPPQAYAPAPTYAPPPPPPAYVPPPAYAPASPYTPPPASHLARLDNAVAEIAARRRALSGETQPAARPAPPPPLHTSPPVAPAEPPVFTDPPAMLTEPPAIVRAQPVPAQDLSGLEEQLRQITDRIDTLRSPGVEQAINALRDELATIAHSLNEAMPQQAIEAIERQIQGLSQRIAEGRQNGGDSQALANLEHGLAEVREALRTLTPAENLAGFHDAIELLGQKIDYIVAQRDPASLEQLENAINTLRQVSTHIASNDAVTKLASDVEMLAEKIDRFAHVGAGDALNGLEARIAALSDALAQRSQSGVTVPPKLESLVNSLADKIERLQNSRGDDVAFGHLEDRIVKLVEKLDASDSRLAHLEAIERGLADLLVNMETMRAQVGMTPPREGGDVGELKQDIVRTQTELQSVHGALSQIMDRLGQIEKGIRTPVGPDEIPAAASLGRVAVRAVPVSEAPLAPVAPPSIAEPDFQPGPERQPAAPTPPATEPARRMPRAKNLPSNPNLPPDLPLEPGSGPPRFRADPAARIAASEAALGDAMPEAAALQGKSGFLAAARRAAQAALRDTSKRKEAPRPPEHFSEDEPADKPSLRQRLLGRVKSLMIAASVIAIVIGGLHLSARYLDLVENARHGDGATQLATTEPTQSEARLAEPDTTPTGSTTQAPAPLLPGMVPPPSPFGYSAGNPLSGTPMLPNTPTNSASGAAPSTEAQSDITGSVARRPSGAPPQAAATDDLPTSIGSPHLRKAAQGGDASAAYEVGVRFAEGRGVAASAADSARWFERAARAGLAPAQFRLGSMYEKGIGVRRDLEKAKQAYLAAASQGNAKAMHNLAVLYAEGTAGKPDYDSAVKWFRKAATYGVPDSQYNLGVLCARGLGTPKDFAESYKWFALAANTGDKDAAKKRDEVGTHLDPRALATAQATVKSWAPERQPPLATTVTEPTGGWDAKPAAPRQTRTSALEARR